MTVQESISNSSVDVTARRLCSDVQFNGRTRLARVFSSCFDGIQGYLCEVEVCLMQGLPIFEIVGSADAALRGAMQRIKPALRISNFKFPDTRIVVNIKPAWLAKRGTSFDLPICLGILMASGQIKTKHRISAFGEISLDGSIHPVPGAFVLARTLLEENHYACLIPNDNYEEVSQWYGDMAIGCSHLLEVIEYLQSGHRPNCVSATQEAVLPDIFEDISLVKGQFMAVEALKIAACGGHHILLVGSPGCGKSSLAKCLPGLLPDLSLSAQREVAALYSISGYLLKEKMDFRRPFLRAPHFTTTKTALFGGGRYPLPGELSLAHRGVLLLDEVNKLDQAALSGLLDPLEMGHVRVTRLRQQVSYPAKFQLIATANPCACGRQLEGDCRCPEGEIMRYRRKLIAPLLDRIDLQVGMMKLSSEDLHKTVQSQGESESIKVRKRITEAQSMQMERHQKKGVPFQLNAHVPGHLISELWGINTQLLRYSEKVAHQFGLSVRAYQKILRVARTIADYDLRAQIEPRDIDLALHFRSVYQEVTTHE